MEIFLKCIPGTQKEGIRPSLPLQSGPRIQPISQILFLDCLLLFAAPESLAWVFCLLFLFLAPESLKLLLGSPHGRPGIFFFFLGGIDCVLLKLY